MKWLVNVADEMDDESQRLGLRVLVRAGLEYVYLLLQGCDDVGGGQRRQGGAIGGERGIDEVKLFERIKLSDRSKVVSPVSGVDEVQVLRRYGGGIYWTEEPIVL